jgi:hypothetical protein
MMMEPIQEDLLPMFPEPVQEEPMPIQRELMPIQEA